MTDAGRTSPDLVGLCRKIEQLLQRRCEVCRTLIGLSERQNALIEHEEPIDELMVVLGRKQTLIDDLQVVEDELRPLREVWVKSQDAAEADQRERIRGLAGRAEDVLKRVLELEEVARSSLVESQQRVVEELTHIDKGRRLVKAYGRPELNEARAIDHQT